MQIKVVKKRTSPVDTNYTVPVTTNQKQAIEEAKKNGMDVNEMTRMFLDKLIEASKSGQHSEFVEL
jgi:hypothetical protein